METDSTRQVSISRHIKHTGQLLTASELRSARKYWHVFQSNDQERTRIYPSSYKPHVIGMMWQTMAQFQTWFGSSTYLAYGIQLLPLTPISEARDGLDWSKSMYASFADSCVRNEGCRESGWKVLQLAMLATVGHKQLALDGAQDLHKAVFEDPGGNGHSLSNTLWYISTRPKVQNPLPLSDDQKRDDEGTHKHDSHSEVTTCGRRSTCTDFVLDTVADLYTCRQRINWLMQQRGESQTDACMQVAVHEFPRQCGRCNPIGSSDEEPPHAVQCPPCSETQCASTSTTCPTFENTYVCTRGPNLGGCSDGPWELSDMVCSECCELSNCPVKPDAVEVPSDPSTDDESSCPPCSRKVCRQPSTLCPQNNASPFFCMEGPSKGGCSRRPWLLGPDCKKCCKLNPRCGD